MKRFSFVLMLLAFILPASLRAQSLKLTNAFWFNASGRIDSTKSGEIVLTAEDPSFTAYLDVQKDKSYTLVTSCFEGEEDCFRNHRILASDSYFPGATFEGGPMFSARPGKLTYCYWLTNDPKQYENYIQHPEGQRQLVEEARKENRAVCFEVTIKKS